MIKLAWGTSFHRAFKRYTHNNPIFLPIALPSAMLFCRRGAVTAPLKAAFRVTISIVIRAGPERVKVPTSPIAEGLAVLCAGYPGHGGWLWQLPGRADAPGSGERPARQSGSPCPERPRGDAPGPRYNRLEADNEGYFQDYDLSTYETVETISRRKIVVADGPVSGKPLALL